MKSLKFKSNLVGQILNGAKTVTWRLFDDKDLREGDRFKIVNTETKRIVGQAIITEIKEKSLIEITEADYEYSNYNKETQADMLKHYREIYGDKVSLNTIVKIIKFKLGE